MELHKLTSLGIKLKSINLDGFYIVSTKDESSIIILLNFLILKFKKIEFLNKSFKKHKHKKCYKSYIIN